MKGRTRAAQRGLRMVGIAVAVLAVAAGVATAASVWWSFTQTAAQAPVGIAPVTSECSQIVETNGTSTYATYGCASAPYFAVGVSTAGSYTVTVAGTGIVDLYANESGIAADPSGTSCASAFPSAIELWTSAGGSTGTSIPTGNYGYCVDYVSGATGFTVSWS